MCQVLSLLEFSFFPIKEKNVIEKDELLKTNLKKKENKEKKRKELVRRLRKDAFGWNIVYYKSPFIP